ncbi:MAG: hypothetical protein OXI54_01020 [Chloroflexota bacterium]|nr:hypothetical protein [Chloroflexota bacterium]MDE2682719.1 hypothetical protein [Chloroflexota bacterium]
MTTITQRPLSPDAIAGLSSIAEACGVLRAWGYPDLADRLAYLASDEDLDEGDKPYAPFAGSTPENNTSPTGSRIFALPTAKRR